MLTFLDRITILAIHQKRNAHFTFKTCSIILHSFFLDIRPIFSMWHSSRFWIIILQQNDPYRFGHAHCAFFKWNIRILRFEHWTDDLKIREHFVEWREKQKYNDSNTHWTLLFSQSSRWLKNHIKSKLPFSKFIFFSYNDFYLHIKWNNFISKHFENVCQFKLYPDVIIFKSWNIEFF